MLCPRRSVYREDGTCSFCGSLDPAVFMSRIEVGDVELGPTDKNYKVYVENKGGAPFEARMPKFYFMHLDKAQRARFVELLNEKRLHIGAPGYFYVLPFFVGVAP